MDIKDRIIQEACPVIMVPRYSELPAIERGYRYLMAADGLWLEARVPWGHFRLPLWKTPRALPYGEVDDVFRLDSGSIPMSLLERCIEAARIKAEKGLEWAGWVVWDTVDGYRLIEPEVIEESFASVRYKYPELNGAHLVMDLHSHPFDMTAFSTVDDRDDTGGIRFSGVISFGVDMQPRLKVRLCIEGHFFELRG
ncbi:MAG: PRTRC system protein A [Deltaproteobacteria bacterium]|nr:PRTRC system protein A [Deltaproteobacteria bacterium]